jgi:hypothetical protein
MGGRDALPPPCGHRAGGLRRHPGTGWPRVVELARNSQLLGISRSQRGFALAVSYWASLEAIDAWRVNSRHVIAKQKGMSVWFERYVTRIAKVERVY